jgi:hypothetical protein
MCDQTSSANPAPASVRLIARSTAVVRVLRAASLSCAAYHAGLKDAERTRTLKDWVTGKIPVVAATIAFGYGLAFRSCLHRRGSLCTFSEPDLLTLVCPIVSHPLIVSSVQKHSLRQI